ncbi:phage tail protein [Burkholderia sp. LMG 21824]|uniref:phage tail protein n=1 Tax=Burkholderia sp. LMG 21824 TaxID=3158172 RepID=UPI003C305838
MQLVLSAAGAIVGGVLGGPLGAQIGFVAGGLIGGILFPPKPPSLHDLTIQDSAYGRWIPTCYGTFRVSGNVIWVSPVTVTEQDKKKAPVEAAQMSIAIALCNGTISSVRRIWANHKLIYDVSNPSNFQAISGSAAMVTDFVVYPGNETQMPDPTMQSYLGVGNVPAHRGIAYVVFNNLNLLPYGNVIPTFEFEVTTNATPILVEAVASQFPYIFSDTFEGPGPGAWQMPNITANGGVAMGVANNPFGAGRAIEAQMTAYGATQLPTITHTFGYNPYGDAKGTSDVPGYIDNINKQWVEQTGWWSSFAPDGFPPNWTSYWRNSNYLYTSGVPIVGSPAWSVYKSTIPAAFPEPMPAGVTVATSVAVTGGFSLFGGTASYVYAQGGDGNIYRLNKSDLSTAATWANPYAGVTNGCVLDDDHIYFFYVAEFILFQPSEGTFTVLGTVSQPYIYHLTAISPNLFMFATTGSDLQIGSPYELCYIAIGGNGSDVTLASIVSDICLRAGLTSGQFDVSQLTDLVYGYGITSYSSARDAIKPLMDTYFFDAVDDGGVLKFVKRGSASVAVFPWADLGAARDHSASFTNDPIQQANEFEQSAPRSLTLTYAGKNNDGQAASQRAFRSLTNSNLDAAAQVGIVFDDGEALTRAQAMMWSLWLGLKKFQFTTTLAYLNYEPTDVVSLTDQNGYQHVVRLTKCQYDGAGVLQWDAEYEYPSIYPNFANFSAMGSPPAGFTPQTIDYNGPSILTVLDVPPLRDSDSSPGLYLAACGFASSWPGISIEVSRDGTTYSSLANDATAAVMGTTTTVLGNFYGGNQPDELNTVTVSLYNGGLSSVDYATFLSGASYAYIGGELVLFRNATQTGANTYVLSGLLRGRAGTEWAMGTHTAGDTFVFLDATKLITENIQVSDLRNTMYFEYQLLNLFFNVVNPVVKQVVNVGRVKPLSPVLFNAGHGSASSTSDISLFWFRRARVFGQWLDGTDVPLDESSESYQLQVLNGSTVVRTVIVNGPFTSPAQPTYTYTAAQITADGFSTGNTINFSVAQNSDQGLLGYAATTSIVR